ncbi:hypothetical protein [Halomicronema sp. CCY15110]|uniref:hypothetical protein n=1 Tax=Halomicronema sp. CCY15110 TaxID=2767773 RepID=UPI00195064B7|nr:hypothetical protein [Halomicronema sp. CCY15110]
MKRRTKALLAMVPLTALALWLDVLEPGQGAFYNPMFWARSQYAKLTDGWAEREPFNLADPLLEECQSLTSENQIKEAQLEARQVITGKSESFALSQLGTPTCALGDGVYRWVSESGLALDLTFNEEGVTDAQLNR